MLRLIADQYSGQPVQPGRQPGHVSAGRRRTGRRAARGPRAEQGRVRPPVRRTARIAPQHEKRTARERPRAARAPGYGYRLLVWPDVPAVPAAGEGGPRATVNDLLVAALIETVRRWNRGRRGAAPGRASGSACRSTRARPVATATR